MNCYVIFKRWLFPSLLLRCIRNKVPLNTKTLFNDLNYRLGFFPSRHKTLSHYVRLLIFYLWILSLNFYSTNNLPNKKSELYRIKRRINAILKYFSRKTSYIRARLAFHLYSKLIREYCNNHRFVPSLAFLANFKLVLNNRSVSGPILLYLCSIKTCFRYGFRLT